MNRYYIKKGLEVHTGPKGQKGQKQSIDLIDVFGEKRVERVTDNVWVAMAYGAAASTIVETLNGIIIVDCGDGEHQAQNIIDDFRAASKVDKPVVGIIYTHWHYALGARSYMKEATEDVQIWADDKMIPNLSNNSIVLGESVSQRGAMHMGVLLPEEGEDALITSGLGRCFLEPNAEPEALFLVPPTYFVTDEAKFEIDGVKVELYNHPSDVTDNLIVNFPDFKVVHQNNIWPGVFNISTSRGDRYRDPLVLISGYERIIDLEPEFVCSTHGKTLVGKEEIKEIATAYKSTVLYVYNQTIRGINDGLDADEIVERFELPQYVLDDYSTAELYGEYAYHIRGIYAGLVGFPTFDPSRFHKLPRKMEGEKMAAAMGGVASVVGLIKQAYADEDFLWGIQLSNYLVAIDPEGMEYKQLKADGLRELGRRTTAASSRNQFTSYALYLEGKVKIGLNDLPFNILNHEAMVARPVSESFELFHYRVEGIKAFDTGIKVQFVIGDEMTDTFAIEYGVLLAVDEQPNCVVTLDKDNYASYLSRAISFEAMLDHATLNDDSMKPRLIEIFK